MSDREKQLTEVENKLDKMTQTLFKQQRIIREIEIALADVSTHICHTNHNKNNIKEFMKNNE